MTAPHPLSPTSLASAAVGRNWPPARPHRRQRRTDSVFFDGQLVFPDESCWTRLLHNFAVFALRREFFRRSLPFLIVPVRV